jgi:hypothetical protein
MFVCKHLVRFFENHAQNLNTPQNNSAKWGLQMGFNWVFKGLNIPRYSPDIYCTQFHNSITHILQYISSQTPISIHNELRDIGELKQQTFKISAFDGILEQYICIIVRLHSYAI